MIELPATNRSAGLRCFERLLAPITPTEFFRDYWQKDRLLVGRQSKEYFDYLLTVDDLDRLLSEIALPATQVNLGMNAVGVPREAYSEGRFILPDKVMRLHREGNTIILRAMHFWLPKLRALCEAMEELFLCDAQTNIYLTPENTQSSYPHWDAHDIFVIQIAGSKRWELHECEMQLPLPRYEFDPAKHSVGRKIGEVHLRAGDIAYIPRGCAHSPKADDYSVHISLGVKVKTWADVLSRMMGDYIDSTRMCREALPIDFAKGEYDIARCLDDLPRFARSFMADAKLQDMFAGFKQEFLSSRRTNTGGVLSSIARSGEVDLDTVVHIPDGSFVSIDADNGSAILNGVRLQFDRVLSEPLEFLGGVKRCRVRDLPAESDAHKLALAQKLVDEGCVVAGAG